MKRIIICIASSLLFACALATSNDPPEVDSKYQDISLSIDERVEILIGQMTLEEKVGQMTQVDRQFLVTNDDIQRYFLGSLLSGGGSGPQINSPENWANMYDEYQQYALNTRLKIPLIYGVDAVHGHNNVKGATVFPHNIGLGATGDPELIERINRATALEVAATGIDWNFSPCIAVVRDIRWGRSYESFSENPDLVSELGAKAILGLQGRNLSDPQTIAATAKHFLADGGTVGGIDQGDFVGSEEELREIHLYPYIAAIEAGAATVMISFSSVDGEKMHGNAELIQTLLRGELGFDGVILSDWAGINQLPGSYSDQVQAGIDAGIDMVMVPDNYVKFISVLKDLVKDGRISQERIDDSVRRILRLKMELDIFSQPFADQELLSHVGSDEHRALAREAVQKSQVILKNDGILPLPDNGMRILVTGSHANNIGFQSGGWTIEWQGGDGEITDGITILEGIQALSKAEIFTNINDVDSNDLDAVICVIGEKPYAEGQGDSETITLAQEQIAFFNQVTEFDVPIITVLVSGRPVILGDILTKSDALVAAWLPGSEGVGVADVLFGKVNPSGKLPVSWPGSVEDLPLDPSKNQYIFDFGFGLQY
jgi:beta-glucosidase